MTLNKGKKLNVRRITVTFQREQLRLIKKSDKVLYPIYKVSKKNAPKTKGTIDSITEKVITATDLINIGVLNPIESTFNILLNNNKILKLNGYKPSKSKKKITIKRIIVDDGLTCKQRRAIKRKQQGKRLPEHVRKLHEIWSKKKK